MISNKKNTSHPFPSEFLHPKVKADKKKFGLPVAKAIYYNNVKNGPSLFYNDRELYESYIRYALGDQDVSQYKPLLGINPHKSKGTFLKMVRWQIKNYATKRVNVAVSKIANRKYMPIFDAIDPLAIDEQKDYRARIKAYIEDSEWFEKVGAELGTNFLPHGMTIDDVPRNDDELDIHMEMDHKHRGAMELEMGVNDILKREKYDELKSQMAFDAFVLGVMVPWTGMDENMKPVVKRKDPARCIFPYMPTQDFNNLPWGASIEDMSVGEFKKMFGNELSKHELEEIIEKHSNANGIEYYGDDSEYLQHKDVHRIQVMHFEYKTTNEKVFLEKKDSFGNERFIEKDYSYYQKEKEQEKFKKKYKDTRKIHRKQINVVYEGYWVVGSEHILKYGPKHHMERSRGALAETAIGYKPFAPNMRNGKIVSIVKQMIPILDDLQSYNLKIQHIIGSAIPKGVAIDLHALRLADLTWGGKKLSDQQKLEMFMQTGIFVFSSKDSMRGANLKPFVEGQNGMSQDLERYLSLIQQSLFELEEVTGINKVTAASTLHKDAGKGVTEMQEMASEVALDYLFRADKYVFDEVVKSLAILYVQSVKYKGNKEYYKRTIGHSSVRFLSGTFDLAKYDFALRSEPLPTQQEWNDFFMDVEKAFSAGILTMSDKIMLRSFTNTKQGYAYMRKIERQRQRMQEESKQADIKSNGEEQRMSQQVKLQGDMELEGMKIQGLVQIEKEKRKTEQMKHEFAMEQLAAKETFAGEYKSRHIGEKGEEDMAIALAKQSNSYTDR